MPLMVVLLLLLVIEFLFAASTSPRTNGRIDSLISSHSMLAILFSFTLHIHSQENWLGDYKSTRIACNKPNKCQWNFDGWHFRGRHEKSKSWEEKNWTRGRIPSEYHIAMLRFVWLDQSKMPIIFTKKKTKILKFYDCERQNDGVSLLYDGLFFFETRLHIESSVTKFTVQFASISNLLDGCLQRMAR